MDKEQLMRMLLDILIDYDQKVHYSLHPKQKLEVIHECIDKQAEVILLHGEKEYKRGRKEEEREWVQTLIEWEKKGMINRDMLLEATQKN